MMNPRMILRTGLVAALGFAAACSSSESTEPQSSLDLNSAVALTTAGDLNSYAGARSAIGVPSVGVPTFDPSQCPYTSSDQSFTCPTRSQNGVTYALKYFLYDSNGQALSQVNPLTAASLRTVLDATGTVASPISSQQGTIAVNHHSDMRLSGLMATVRTLNGTTRTRDTLVTGSGSSTLRTVLDATSTTANLVLPSKTNGYPASGTITTDISGSSAFGGTFSTNSSVHSVLTFNGTNVATLSFNTGFGVTTCQIDLTGAVGPHCS